MVYTLSPAKRIMVDCENQVLEIRSFCLGLCWHHKKVLLSQVESVNIEYRKGESSSSGESGSVYTPDSWSVYLVFKNYKRVEVCSGGHEVQQMNAASTLGRILGKKVLRFDATRGRLGGGDSDYPSRRPPPTWAGF